MKTVALVAGRWLAGLATMVGVVVMALPAAAQSPTPMLLGTLGSGNTPSTLVEIDPATGGLVREIGPVGYTVNGMTYDQTSGILYGSTALGDPNYTGLITIDLTTGAGTIAGVDGWGVAIDSGALSCVTINSSGQMFATDGWGELYAVDPWTGIASQIGDLGTGLWTYGLAFDAADALYLVNGGGEYNTVDTGTGAATSVGDIRTTAHHGDFDPASGLYYGINSTRNPRGLVVADLATGSVVSLFPTVDGLHTLQFVNDTRGPDLIVSTLSHASPSLVTRYLNAGQVYVRCQQTNQGNMGSRSCLLRFWFSSDEILDSGDRPLVGVPVRSLAAGQSTMLANTLLRLGHRLLPGEGAYIIAEVDAADVVSESCETNNTAVLELQAGGDPR